MTNTPFSSQVEIVADYFAQCDPTDEWAITYDLGGPLAFVACYGGVEIDNITEAGRGWITQAFIGILNGYGVDTHGDYDSLDEIEELSEQG